MFDAVRDCGATPDFVNATDDDGAAIAACLARLKAVGCTDAYLHNYCK